MKSVLEYLENNESNNLIVDINGTLSYKELEIKAKRVGSYLAGVVKKNAPVPVFMEKSREALVTFMGTLYAGGFYSLLNTSLPEARLKQIMSVLDVNYIVTNKEYKEKIREFFPEINVILYEDIVDTEINLEKLLAIREKMVDTDPVYANFTSGSTGVPKGVLVGNRSIIDFIDNYVDTFKFSSLDVIGNQAPFDL